MWLNREQPIGRRPQQGSIERALFDNGAGAAVTDLRIARENRLDGLRIGGQRKLKISPRPACGNRGKAGMIPPDSAIPAEIEFIGDKQYAA